MILSIVSSLKLFAAIHIGFGLVQLCLLFFLADIPSYGGDSGFFAHTPLKSYFEQDNNTSGQQVDSLIDLAGLFGWITNLGDVVFSLWAFDYDMLNGIGSDEGLVFYVVLLVRLASWLMSFNVGAAFVQTILSSGIMQSPVGAGAVLLGGGALAGITALGGLI